MWYEQRIREETAKNLKLRQLHEDLTRKKIEQQHSEMNATIDTQNMISGESLTQVENTDDRRKALQDEIDSLKNQIREKHNEIEETKSQINITQQLFN